MKGLIAGLVAIVAVGVLFLFYTSQTPPTAEAGGADAAMAEAQAQQEIMDRWNAYMRQATSMDLETWWSYWTDDVRILEPGMDMSGSEVRAFGEDFFGSGGQVFGLDLSSIEIWVHGDVAYQLGQYDEGFQAPGQERMEAKNYFFARWVRGADGVWKISRFLAGPREAPPEG